MIDWSETRLQIQLWLHQSWPFRVLAWVRMRGVPDELGFGKLRDGSEPLEETVTRLRAEIAKPEARPASAAELLNSLQTGPPELINLFGQPCSQEDADAVLTAADPLQAARVLMTTKLNEMEHR